MRPKPSSFQKLRADLVPEFTAALADFETAIRSQTNPRPEVARALVLDSLQCRASDIHVEPRSSEFRIRLRIDGSMVDVASLNPEQSKWVLNQFKAMAGLDPVVRFTPRDAHARCNFERDNIDLRLALAPSQHGEALTARLLDQKRLERSLSQLGLTQENLRLLEDWLDNTNGMFLCAGPTGSGKTTTVYSLLHELKYADRTIVSLEDPVEYEVDGVTQVQLDEKHHLNFAEGVKSMLRLDPDFLMIGEIRDAASAQAAVDAALTGRVLLSTIHSRDSAGVITALRNWGLEDHELTESVSVVVSQRLVRRLCPDCRQKGAILDATKHWLELMNLPVPSTVWRPVGCHKCNKLGFLGRTGIFEMWQLTDRDYDLILSHADERTIRRHLVASRRGSLLEDGLRKVREGITTLEELRRARGGLYAQELVLAPEIGSAEPAAAPEPPPAAKPDEPPRSSDGSKPRKARLKLSSKRT